MTKNDILLTPEQAAEKAKEVYKKGLISLEILKLKELPESVEEAEKLYDETVKYKTYVIDDLSRPYMIRLAYTEDKSRMRTVDPEYLDEGDKYEISESIQDILRENGFPVVESAFVMDEEEFEVDIDEKTDVVIEVEQPKPTIIPFKGGNNGEE